MNALLGLVVAGCVGAPRPGDPALAAVAADLRPYMQRQAAELGIPGVWMAVLDVDPASGRERLWADAVAATVHSMPPGGSSLDPNPRFDAVHRVASISKLFTDTAAMVLAERGQLDLDAPVDRYLPEFAPHNPFDPAITLRHLMGHRAGIVRESPVGHYFDPSEPSLAATVASLNDTALVHAPGSAFKYSNPAIGVVGEVVARVAGKPFEDAVRELVLAPLGLTDSDFRPRPDLVARQLHGRMWTYDGRDIPTPEFAFGYAPAANLRSTVVDLVRFAKSWFPASRDRVLTRETMERMWELPPGQRRGCGLGFFMKDIDGHRSVGHDGAVYGFASALRALPDDGIAVAVVCTLDFANAAADDLADRALRAALANRSGHTLPAPKWPEPLGVEAARALAGHYRCGDNWVELYERGGELFYDPNIGVRSRLRRAADGALVADDVLGVGGARRLTMQANGRLSDGEVEYVRDDALPPPCPDELLPYLGEYGWDHDVLIVYEDHGNLAVLIEWVVRDLLEKVGDDTYLFPGGM
ncbi:MAG: serine hydrolase domain-containing protein [Planctomycetota bacterium]